MAATATLAPAFVNFGLSRTYSIFPRRPFCRVIAVSLSTEFAVTSSSITKSHKPSPPASDLSVASTSEPGGPWVVRVEEDKAASPHNAQKKKNDSKSVGAKIKSGAPKYSKAARRFYNENFRDAAQRLAKVLASAGVASRRSSEELIFQGKVTVNGSICKTPQTKVDPGQDVIYVNGCRLAKKLPPKVYLALNKPKGYICSAGEEEKSVISLLDDYMKSWIKRNPGVPQPRLFTVGRLDVATTGLIIVTNDGEFANKISHPSFNISREYIATINDVVSKQHLVTISKGTVIDGVHCVPDMVELLPREPGSSKTRIRVVVHEGRNREVRELVRNAGLQIHSLKRIRIGGFRLPTDLPLGKHIELSSANLKALFGE